MKKSQFIQLCTQYGANPTAVKELLGNKGLKRKEINKNQLVKLIYVNCTNLLYCRNMGYEMVEYASHEQSQRLIDDVCEMTGAS